MTVIETRGPRRCDICGLLDPYESVVAPCPAHGLCCGPCHDADAADDGLRRGAMAAILLTAVVVVVALAVLLVMAGGWGL